jgi:hypothetical protein
MVVETEAIAEVAATAEVATAEAEAEAEVINAGSPPKMDGILIRCSKGF